jgi:benzoyl-CoA reductase/2-hydroxyglutaryl-CoA dehydratase subunit BcrC/BadD/HgdB
MSQQVGFTTTVPIEVIVAAGGVPVDLNNRFINSPDPQGLVERAEQAGFPHSVCGWVKGIYSVAVEDPEIQTIIAVTQGDCSNTHALMELYQRAGKEVIPFAYPYDRDRDLLALKMRKLCERFQVSEDKLEQATGRLDAIRKKLARLDELTWKENKVSGSENHLYLVSASDFNSDPDEFEAALDRFLQEAETRAPMAAGVRLGFLGVPPIFSDFYQTLEDFGARVVFNEMQRQFSMISLIPDLIERYLAYTYPYDVFGRIADIKKEAAARQLDGLIHYVQSFCFRQIEDIMLREELELPILTLEGDKPMKIDTRTRLRLEAFVEMLAERKGQPG